MITNIVGLPLDEAKRLLKAMGASYRVVSVDGNAYIVTADYRPARLNMKVVNNKVSAVYYG